MKQIKNVSLTLDKTLIVTDLERVFEVSTKNKEILWEYPCHAKFANKLKNGNIIICDEKNSKVIELDSNKNIVWEYQQEKAPSHVMRLPNNNSIITTPFEHFVKEINDKGDIIWSFGEKDISGNDKRLFLPEYAREIDPAHRW